MGITERKEREKTEMRERIINGAMRMFLEEGYEKTSIRNIAEKIEYSPATIYLYYRDKDELLYEVQRLSFEHLVATFTKEVTATDPLKRLEQLCNAYVNFGWEHQEMYDLMFIIRAPMNVVNDSHDWKNGHDAFAFLVNCVTECIEQQLIRFTDVMIAALSIWSMTHGMVSLDIRCRFKMLQTTEDGVKQAVMVAVKEYLKMIQS